MFYLNDTLEANEPLNPLMVGGDRCTWKFFIHDRQNLMLNEKNPNAKESSAVSKQTLPFQMIESPTYSCMIEYDKLYSGDYGGSPRAPV